jgi:SpoVK/Ycf46/Vps4 family AAA+-type ATPase
MGATNRPQEIDEAARRRFVKRIYIPLPDAAGRLQLLDSLMAKHNVKLSMSKKERKQIADRTANYSGADLFALCGDAAMAPVRELTPDQIQTIDPKDVRAVGFTDLREACDRTRPSVGAAQVAELVRWNDEFGSQAGA